MKKSIKTLFLILPVLLVMSVCTPVSTLYNNDMQIVEAAKKKVKLNCSKKTLLKGKKFQLKLKNNKKKIKWSSSKKSVATVNKNGKVTAKKAGKTVITAKVGKKKYKCKITVENPKISSTALTVYQGEYISLYMDGTNQLYDWKSTDSSVVSIDRWGEPKSVGVGQCTVYTKVLGKTFSCKVTVKEPFIKNDALRAITKKEVVTNNGILVYLTNYYKYDCLVDIDAIFSNGNKSVKSENNSILLGSKQSTVLFIRSYDDTDYEDFAFKNYNIKYSVSDIADSDYVLCTNKISCRTQYGDDSVLAILNSAVDKNSSALVTIIFYKNNKIIGVDYGYSELMAKGSDIIEFSFPYTYDEYDDIVYITPDKYEVIISEAYYTK